MIEILLTALDGDVIAVATIVAAPAIVTTLFKTYFVTKARDIIQPDLTLTFAMHSTAINRSVTANKKTRFHGLSVK